MSTNAYYNTATALQIRLETSQIIENIEMYLKGSVMVAEQDPATGRIKMRTIVKGVPKANAYGIQSILNWIQMVLNPQVVQGNFPSDSKAHSAMYEEFIYMLRIDFTELLIINCYEWEIKDSEISGIVDSVMNLTEPFMTRLIDNKERESYAQSLRSTESSSIKEKDENKGFKLFG